MTQWKTQDGKIIALKDMTNTHLVNAIKYKERQTQTDRSQRVYTDLERLQREHRRRWDAVERPCPFCDGKMTRAEQRGDVDSWLTPWRWSCGGCGALSGEVPGYSLAASIAAWAEEEKISYPE